MWVFDKAGRTVRNIENGHRIGIQKTTDSRGVDLSWSVYSQYPGLDTTGRSDILGDNYADEEEAYNALTSLLTDLDITPAKLVISAAETEAEEKGKGEVA